MIARIRDQALALACLRLGLPAANGRGLDLLPREVIQRFEGSLLGQLDRTELIRTFGIVAECLLQEVRQTDTDLVARLRPAMEAMVDGLKRDK